MPSCSAASLAPRSHSPRRGRGRPRHGPRRRTATRRLSHRPTTMRLPLHKGNFRLTHRFAGNLRNGTFGQQAGNLFGLDQGAIIGFEYRVAVMRRLQAAAYRSSFDKTIQLYGKYDAIRQRRSTPVSVSAVVSIEGTDNF